MTAKRRLVSALGTGALALALGSSANAVDYPTLKSGQWEMTTNGAGAPGAAGGPRKSTICLDTATQKSMIEMGVGMQKEMCAKMDMRNEGAKFVTDAECRIGASVVKSHGVMTMTGDTAYRTETSATFDPPLGKDVRESKTVIEGRYTGPCRDGMKPGDMITDTGQKINVNQMQQRPSGQIPPPRPPAPQ
jgi:hypothetical protein